MRPVSQDKKPSPPAGLDRHGLCVIAGRAAAWHGQGQGQLLQGTERGRDSWPGCGPSQGERRGLLRRRRLGRNEVMSKRRAPRSPGRWIQVRRWGGRVPAGLSRTRWRQPSRPAGRTHSRQKPWLGLGVRQRHAVGTCPAAGVGAAAAAGGGLGGASARGHDVWWPGRSRTCPC